MLFSTFTVTNFNYYETSMLKIYRSRLMLVVNNMPVLSIVEV